MLRVRINGSVGGGGSVPIGGGAAILVNNGAPVDGVTGVGVAGPGSLCIDTANKKLYQQTGADNINTVWRQMFQL